MSEADQKSLLVKALAPLHALRIESPSTGIGIPDINCVGAWIECKWLRSWPKRAETHPVIFGHPLTKEQGLWLWKRTLAGGLALCCCQVQHHWFFFDGLTIKDRFNKMTKPEMEFESVLHFPRGLEKERLIQWIRSHSKA